MRIRDTLGAFLALAAVAAAPALALAQNRGAMMAERQQAFTDTVVVQLALPEEQEQAFRAIMAEQLEGMQALFKEYEGRRDPQMREDAMAIQAETDEKLEAIFTEEQMARFNEMRDAQRAQFRQGRQPPPQG
jgi:Spy/CpxP family protein refolding chaperone